MHWIFATAVDSAAVFVMMCGTLGGVFYSCKRGWKIQKFYFCIFSERRRNKKYPDRKIGDEDERDE